MGRVKFSGLSAWLFWLFVHIYFLIGFRNRLVVFMDWAWAYFTSQRHARVFPDLDAKRQPAVRCRDGGLRFGFGRQPDEEAAGHDQQRLVFVRALEGEHV